MKTLSKEFWPKFLVTNFSNISKKTTYSRMFSITRMVACFQKRPRSHSLKKKKRTVPCCVTKSQSSATKLMGKKEAKNLFRNLRGTQCRNTSEGWTWR